MAALDAARPGMAKLDASRHPEEIAADIIEIWSSVETALRSLMGGSTLSGQALIRELRTRELISLEQAHSLLELQAVRERVDDTTYQPAQKDIDTAREAYDALQSGLVTPVSARAGAASPYAPPAATPTIPPQSPSAEPAQVYVPPPREEDVRRRRSIFLGALLILLAIVLVAGGVYWYRFRSGSIPSDVRAAIALYERGQPEAARGAFTQAARAHPRMALPHLYLGRIARSEGDFAAAGNELKTAIELEPQNTMALNELGAFFLARGTSFANQGRSDLASSDYNAARRNYVRALQLDPADSSARGFLGCALARLGRTTEAESWLARAGSGPWTECASSGAAAGAAPRGP
ncbi:MAG TPA: tetratricopeptide repeat protein [Gemmatimonadaceae bacterium]|nr:tetratricopeptide repeat protein [Gemmatimonadaceae bacterium]